MLFIVAISANLEWQRLLIHKYLDDMVEGNVKQHCIDLSQDLSQYYNVEYSEALEDFLLQKEFVEKLVQLRPIHSYMGFWSYQLDNEMVVQSERLGGETVSFKTATLYSPERPLTESTQQLAESLGIVGEMIKGFYGGKTRYTYIGFEVGNLFMQFPGKFVGLDHEFYVKVSEWYYAAQKFPDRVFAAAPNKVENIPNQFEFLLSKVLTDIRGNVVGVIAVEFLSNISPLFDEIRVLESGFSALVAERGQVLNNPHVWYLGKLSGDYTIFQEDITGIDLNKWKEIVDPSRPDDEIFDIDIPGAGLYSLARSHVKDIHGFIVYVILV